MVEIAKPLTWNEFKERVDERLKKQRISADSPVGTIDVCMPCDNDLTGKREKNRYGVSVSGKYIDIY